MLFFIAFARLRSLSTADLNTSHVILYQTPQALTGALMLDLNTSHVILYRTEPQDLQQSKAI